MWKHPPGKVMDNLNALWSTGIFVGVKPRSNELISIDETIQETK
jgi:hypothetical protein